MCQRGIPARYSLLAVNPSRDQQGGCSGARAVTLMLPAAVCIHLTSPQAGYSHGDGHYMALLNGDCSLELRTTDPRVQVSGFVPDAVNPRAGDVYLPFNNPHYSGSGSVTFSSFALELVDAPSAIPNGTNSTKVTYSQAAILNTYANGRLDRKKALTLRAVRFGICDQFDPVRPVPLREPLILLRQDGIWRAGWQPAPQSAC